MAPSADALSLKEEGNAEFKAGRYKSAIDAYTGSIAADPSQHTVFSNRSAAYVKLGGKAEEALKDAETCVQLAPSWPKGYTRLADALQELGRWEEAAEAVDRGLKAVPGDDALAKKRDEVAQRTFRKRILGPWHGMMHAQVEGLVQEFEFLDEKQLRVTVLGKPTSGEYMLDLGKSPYALNISMFMDPTQLPPGVSYAQAMAMGMRMPWVPHIVKMDGDELTICAPTSPHAPPTKFEGKGLTVLKRGTAPTEDFSADLAGIDDDERLRRCLKEFLEAVPDEKLEPNEGDSEAEMESKILRVMQFKQSEHRIRERFGTEAMSHLFDSLQAFAKNDPASIHAALAGCTGELKQLEAKLRASGALEDGEAEGGPPPGPSSTTRRPPAPSAEAAAAPADSGKSSAPVSAKDDETPTWLLIASGAVVCAALAAAFYVHRRRR